jgi:hypothetical protein
MDDSQNLEEVLDIAKRMFGDENIQIKSDRLKIDYPDSKDVDFIAYLSIEKLVWGEPVIVLEVLNVDQFNDDEPYIFHLTKNMNFETKWFFPFRGNAAAFAEFALNWLDEYLKSELVRLEVYRKYIDIRKDPTAKLRLWKLGKFL